MLAPGQPQGPDLSLLSTAISTLLSRYYETQQQQFQPDSRNYQSNYFLLQNQQPNQLAVLLPKLFYRSKMACQFRLSLAYLDLANGLLVAEKRALQTGDPVALLTPANVVDSIETKSLDMNQIELSSRHLEDESTPAGFEVVTELISWKKQAQSAAAEEEAEAIWRLSRLPDFELIIGCVVDMVERLLACELQLPVVATAVMRHAASAVAGVEQQNLSTTSADCFDLDELLILGK
ncbi:unnamed protein product [Protopolystoma xenopodis]|uniref:Uncharacterized protein n=1 Tax=Protopolystoma xenopodis TaxID=117903 RepID=A0A3S5A6A1_9PLAT|nr:unnamed protein product [Protopolystoma xenopodis]